MPTITILRLEPGCFWGLSGGMPRGIAHDKVSVLHLSREQCLLEPKESCLFFKNVKWKLFPPNEIQGTTYIKQVLGAGTAAVVGWYEFSLHTYPRGAHSPPPRRTQGKCSAHQASPPWISQFKDWAPCLGHRKVYGGPRATNTVPVLLAFFFG